MSEASRQDESSTFGLVDALYDQAEEIAFLIGAGGGLSWISPNVSRLFGITREEVHQVIGPEMVHPGDQDRVAASLADLADPGATLTSEHRILVNGEVRWIHVTLHHRATGPEPGTIVGNLREITRQRDAEAAMRLEASLLAPAFQAISVLDPDGLITYWNDASTDMYGWTADEAVGCDVLELVPLAEGADDLADAVATDIGRAHPWTRELTLVDKDGETVTVMATATPLVDADGTLLATTVVSYDTTENRRSQEAAARLAAIVSTSQEAIFSIDLEGQITSWNEGASRLFGYSEEDAIGREARSLVEAEDQTELIDLFLKAYEGERAEGVVVAGHCADGTTVFVSVSMSSIQTPGGTVIGMSIIAHDATERHRTEAALTHEATHDPLSGLPNRRLLVQRLEDSLQRSNAEGRHTGVVFIDLDDFKRVNDMFGHAGGDRLLRDVGQRLAAAMGEDDVLARLGGDEYVAACGDLEDIDALVRVADRICRLLSLPFRAGHETIALTASVGIALSRPDTRAEALIRNADIAMYAAKEAGGARIERFDDELYEQARKRNLLRSEIDAGIGRGEFHTSFQPEVVLADGRLFGFEALARWTHPQRGPVSPAEFIANAENSGAIIRLGHQILNDACRAAQSWEDPLGPQLVVSVNLSPVQVADAGLQDSVIDALERSGLHPSRLCLEVTESALMDFESATKTIGRLKDLGVSIAIDDFGTGYSSLSRLKDLPVDFLKIDKSFIDGLGRHAEDDAIVSAMIGLSHSLGIEVIAEGIENEVQLERLREFGCSYGQGYLWSRPIPEAEAARYTLSNPSFDQ